MKIYKSKYPITKIIISDEFADAADKYKLVHKRGDLKFPHIPFIKFTYKENMYMDMSNKHIYTYDGVRNRFWESYGKYYKCQFERYYMIDYKTGEILRKPYVEVHLCSPLKIYTWAFKSVSDLNDFVKNNKDIQDFINNQSK